MISVLIWWLLIQVLGVLALPFCLRLFRWLPDRGYTFSKALGLLLASYFLWFGASTRLLQNDLGGILLALLLVAGLSAWALLKPPADGPSGARFSIRLFLREKRRLVLWSELIFAFGFIAWAILRAYAPDKIMNAGGEKFMEIAFLNATLNSSFFPPLDPWLSGFAISYYYFGYVMMALMTRLSGVSATVGFELYDVLLFALTLVGAFGVVYNLVAARQLKRESATEAVSPSSVSAAPLVTGLLGALFVAVLGNLEGLLEALYARGILPASFWSWINIPGLAAAPVTGSFYPGHSGGWWWWRASRVLNDLDLLGRPVIFPAIDEFPFFSFLLGDNHPHVLALPFVLLAIALAYNLMRRQALSTPASTASLDEHPLRPPWWNPVAFSLDGDWVLFLSSAVILGSLAFLNTWDFPIYLGLLLLAYGLGAAWSRRWSFQEILSRLLSLGAGLGLASILLYIFFYFSFSSQAAGILPYVFPPTRLPQFLVMFGHFIFVVALFLAACLVWNSRRLGVRAVFLATLRLWAWVVGICVGLFAILMVGVVYIPPLRQIIEGLIADPALQAMLGSTSLQTILGKVIADRLADPWLFLLLSLLIALALASGLSTLRHAYAQPGPAAGVEESPPLSELFVFLLIFISLALTLSVEFFYLRDSFGLRMNTIFKFYYQAWVMLACASGFGLWWLFGHPGQGFSRLWRSLAALGVGLLVLAGMVYPVLAGYSRAAGFQGTPNLDGASALAAANPDDWAAIHWLQANAFGVPVILEAPGKSYNYEGRISAFTGFPAVLGWAVHESQWRGNYDEQGKREPDINTIYTTNDVSLMLDLLQKWQVDYVVIGAVERSYIQEQCSQAVPRCNLASALRKFDQVLQPVFAQGQLIIYQVPAGNQIENP